MQNQQKSNAKKTQTYGMLKQCQTWDKCEDLFVNEDVNEANIRSPLQSYYISVKKIGEGQIQIDPKLDFIYVYITDNFTLKMSEVNWCIFVEELSVIAVCCAVRTL